MKALFWKEFRENLKWAILAMGIIIAAISYSLRYNPNDPYSLQQDVWQGLQSGKILMITGFGFPVLGIALGFLQILTELRRDQWAFLVHRPVTRQQVFWGKAIPGTILYLLATGIPIAGTAWWLATPGNIPAPFSAGQVLPAIIDSLAGLCFYFAALLSGILPGRWYGRRALPLVAACFATLSAKNYQFSQALTGVLLALVCLVIAAAAMHGAAGIFRRCGRVGKIAQSLTYLLAISVLLGWFWIAYAIIFPQAPYTSQSYSVYKTGEVVVVSQTANWYDSVVTLDGRKITPEKKSFDWKDFNDGAYLYLGSSDPYSSYYSNYRFARRYFDQVYSYYASPYTWYYIKDLNCFEAFSMLGKTSQGYLGPNGFASPENPSAAGHFDVIKSAYTSNDIVTAKDGLYRPDLNAQTVSKFYTTPPGEAIRTASIIYDRERSSEGAKDYVVVTTNSMEILPHSGPQAKIPLTADPKKYQNAEIYKTPEGYLLFYSARESLTFPPLLLKISPEGAILGQQTLPILGKPTSRKWRDWLKVAIDPMGNRIWNQVQTWAHFALGDKSSSPIWKWKKDDQRKTLFDWLIASAVGIACALVVQIPLKQKELSGQRLGWTLFVLLFSLGGLLVFWIANDWPRRIACPSCGRKRSVERETCEHCGAGWPAPKQDGTEIWEGLTEEATPPAAR